VGANDLVCPINISLHQSSKSFRSACKNRSVHSSSISFKFAEELRVVAGAEGTQEERRAPPEAATGGENTPTFRECFADIWAGESIDHPYNQSYNTRNYKPTNEYVTLHLYLGRVCLEDGKHEIIYPKASSLSLPSSPDLLNFIVTPLMPKSRILRSDPPDSRHSPRSQARLADADDAWSCWWKLSKL
jgi:hypothetical protein